MPLLSWKAAKSFHQILRHQICSAGSICIEEVNDTHYYERFFAVADAGWYFEKWNSGYNFLCGDSIQAVCEVSSGAAEGIPAAEEFIASSETIYLMPIFKRKNLTTDTITVNGKEWAQVDLFYDLSWNDINAVCPSGICSGELNGFDMTGWTWASVEDVNTLFNYYIGFEALGPGPDSYDEDDSEWGPAFFHDGWRPTNHIPVIAIDGLLLDQNPGEGEAALTGGIVIDAISYAVDDVADTDRDFSPEEAHVGAWFYRTP